MTSGQPSPSFDLRTYLDSRVRTVDAALDRFLPPAETPPAIIHQAMRYSVFAGGKRLRPVLALATGEALGGEVEPLLHFASALEMIHAFSLIHDDLPSMDNDDFRRGVPTLHRKYNEAIAVLAGDGLLALAFEVLAGMPQPARADQRLKILGMVAEATGTCGGMIGGQVADITTEGQAFTDEDLDFIHRSKTGALIRAAVVGAAGISGADDEILSRMERFGRALGLAFQIVDDLLDVEGCSHELGKRSGKDAEVQKATYPALHGLEASRARASALREEALDSIAFLGDPGIPLREIAQFVTDRRH